MTWKEKRKIRLETKQKEKILSKRTKLSTVKFPATLNQIKMLDEYQEGDFILINNFDYIKLINKQNKRNKDSERVTQSEFGNKTTRPLMVIYNNEYSNFMLVVALTTVKGKNNFFKYELDSATSVNYDVFKLNKNRVEIINDGNYFITDTNKCYMEPRQLEEYKKTMKRDHISLYVDYLEHVNAYQKTVIKRDVK